MPTSEPLIVLDRVCKVFITDEVETHALEDISLEIHSGEFVAVDGPSGCGKSTLLSIIGLLDTTTSGRFSLKGKDTSGLSGAARAQVRNREIGFIFQSFNLIGNLTVAQNVELPLKYRGISPVERRRAVTDVLGKVGLLHRAKHLPSQLSGGQQQRVAVARAVVGRPSIVLADEPTGNLDSTSGSDVMALLSSLHREGATICMVTHDARHAGHAERAIHLFDGRIADRPHLAQAGGSLVEAVPHAVAG